MTSLGLHVSTGVSIMRSTETESILFSDLFDVGYTIKNRITADGRKQNSRNKMAGRSIK